MARRRRTHKNRPSHDNTDSCYLVEDGDLCLYRGDDIHQAFALMRKASNNAKLYRIDEDEEGALSRVLLAFRRGLPASAMSPF